MIKLFTRKGKAYRAKPIFVAHDAWLLRYDSEGARWTLGYIIKFTLLEKWHRIFGPSSKADEYARVLAGWRMAYGTHVDRYTQIHAEAERRGLAVRTYCHWQAMLNHPDKPADWSEEAQEKMRQALPALEKLIAPEPLPGPDQWTRLRVTSEGKFAYADDRTVI
jgi:hypothetical protein